MNKKQTTGPSTVFTVALRRDEATHLKSVEGSQLARLQARGKIGLCPLASSELVGFRSEIPVKSREHRPGAATL